MSGCIDNQEVGLEAATLERVRNSSLVKCSGADNSTGLKLDTEDVDVQIYLYVVGERSDSFEAVAEALPWSGQK